LGDEGIWMRCQSKRDWEATVLRTFFYFKFYAPCLSILVLVLVLVLVLK